MDWRNSIKREMDWSNNIKRESAWKFDTSRGGNFGLGVFGIGSGAIHLKDPGGQTVIFNYQSAGGGLSFGVANVKRIGAAMKGSASGSTTDDWSKGKVYITQSFAGSELSAADLRGICLYLEAGAGLIIGGAATLMLLNVPPSWLANSMKTGLGDVGDAILRRILRRESAPPARDLPPANAVLAMLSVNKGLQASAGVMGYAGYFR